MIRIASFAVVACLVMAPQAFARQTPAPVEMTLERQAGCGLALLALDRGFKAFPRAAMVIPAEQRSATRFMLAALSAQGRTILDDAFAQGAQRGWSPSQVYEAGLDDMMVNFKDVNPRDRNAAATVLQSVFERCSAEPAAPAAD